MEDTNQLEHILPPTLKDLVQQWLQDDIPSLDVGGFVVGETDEVAFLLGKSDGVLAGVPFFNAVFEALGCTVVWHLKEGNTIDTKSVANGKVIVAKVRGSCRNILLGERTALNIVTRASGIATQALDAVKIGKNAGWHGQVAGTRKTTPGFRLVEKYALLVAGAATHRYDLSQMVMLKDNHIRAAGSISNAVQKAKRIGGFSIKIEVECGNLEEATEAATAGADIVMLDNFTPDQLKQTAKHLRLSFPHLLIEASGGITVKTMRDFMSPVVDVISLGTLTQGYPCVDFSLKIQRNDSVISAQ